MEKKIKFDPNRSVSQESPEDASQKHGRGRQGGKTLESEVSTSLNSQVLVSEPTQQKKVPNPVGRPKKIQSTRFIKKSGKPMERDKAEESEDNFQNPQKSSDHSWPDSQKIQESEEIYLSKKTEI